MRSRLSYGFSLLILGIATVAILSPGPGTAEDLGPNNTEIKKRIESWKAKAPELTKGISFEAPPTTVVSEQGTEKAIAICMGLNQVDPARYAGWSGPLTGCEGDADAMAEIASKSGFKVKVLKTRDATRDKFERLVLDAAKQLQDDGILLVSYSGHGGQVPDMNGDEIDGEDETWCLYDGEIIDDDLCVLWQQFKRPARILIVADSCHSGTSAKAVPVREAARHALDLDPGTHSALAPSVTANRAAVLKKRYDARKGADISSPLPHAFKSMPRSVFDAIQADPRLRAEYQQRGLRYTKEQVSQDRVTAAVITLAACQDNQQAGDGDKNGLFTETLVRVWRGGAFNGDYKKFHKALQQQMPTWSQPNLDPFGKDLDRFLSQTPFQVGK